MRIGIVGAGGMGNTHANKYRQMRDVELAVTDVDTDRAVTFAERHGASEIRSLAGLVEWADIVDICLPTDLHLDIALRAIAAGKAVLVEKPMASTVEECAAMIEAAGRAGTPLMPAQVLRFFPEFATAKRLVESGAIGRPAAARTRRGGKAPTGAGGWFLDPARSGGILLDLAIHDFDWLRWTLGEVGTVYARSVRIRPEWVESFQAPAAGDYALTTLGFEGGCVAHVETTWMEPGPSRVTFEVCGSEGMLEFDSRHVPTVRTATADAVKTEAPLAPDDDPYYLQLRSFVDAVTGGTPPPVTPLDGLRAVAISRAAIESAETGRAIRPARG
jgi:predicted dehydrogenase